jgi:hypothetical protein
MFSNFLSQRPTHAPSKTPGRSTMQSASQLRHLIQEYASDVHARALATAIISSGISALQRPGCHISSDQLLTYFDHDQGRSDLLKEALLEALPGVSDLYASGEFDDQYKAAGRVLQNFHFESKSIGPTRAAALLQNMLEEIWHDCCRSAQFALDELETVLSPDLPQIYVQNHNVLTGLLNGASNGLSPCFDQFGSLYAPPLPQQRRWARRAVLQDCQIIHDGQVIKAFVRDASAGGLGLDQVPPMKRRATITIVMEGGRTLQANVAWSSGRSAGVTFAEPLAANDPLIWG